MNPFYRRGTWGLEKIRDSTRFQAQAALTIRPSPHPWCTHYHCPRLLAEAALSVSWLAPSSRLKSWTLLFSVMPGADHSAPCLTNQPHLCAHCSLLLTGLCPFLGTHWYKFPWKWTSNSNPLLHKQHYWTLSKCQRPCWILRLHNRISHVPASKNSQWR